MPTRTLWFRLPYEFPVFRNAKLSKLSGEALLVKAAAQWDALWARGARVRYANQQLNDFFDSSIAYALILVEYDAQGFSHQNGRSALLESSLPCTEP